MNGLKLAALCGFYPHRLGFCGPKNSSAKKNLSVFLSGKKVSAKKIRKILTGFKGAFSYYKLIAKSNRIEDPFDERVVKAYWFGNRLLEKVPVSSLKEMLVKEFGKAKELPFTLKPHHSFHVLAVGSVSGRVVLEGNLLDLCRIGWGRVMAYKNKGKKEGLIIRYQPLQKRNRRYFLGKPINKFIFWDNNFIPKIKIGDIVSTHWNYVIQVLNKRDLVNLKKYTQITIDSLNEIF